MRENTSTYKKHTFLTLFFWHHFLAMKTALRRLFASPVSAIIVCVVIGLTLALPTGLMVLLQ
ncbi:MAG: cell division protein, partial [Gammaproteobacteria bacterium]|nr:cell division protein [Gammaproteobacteria bacterium]